MSNSREHILERLRAAVAETPAAERPALPTDREVYADYLVADRAALPAQFAQRLTALRGEFHAVADEAAAAACLSELLKTAEPGGFLAQDDPLIRRVLGALPGLAERFAPPGEIPESSVTMAEASVGLTRADALVARTGSVVLRTAAAGGRRLSVLPPLHVVLAPAADLLPSLEDALLRVGPDPAWSCATIISGPSRTADIEKILVLGAHGPKRLAVILIG